MKRRDCVVSLVLTLLGAATASQACAQPPFKPRCAESVIEVAGKTIRPLKTRKPWREEHWAGDVCYVLDGAELTVSRGSEKVFQQTAPTHQHWRWLTCDAHCAYLTTTPEIESQGADRYTMPARIWRFDHVSRHEAVSVPVGPTKPDGEKQAVIVVDAVATRERCLVLTATILDDPTAHDDGRMLEYQVTCFDPGAASARWEKVFKSAGERAEPGAYLWAPRRPTYASSDIQYLSMMDDKIIVCAGPVQDILCLDSAKGELAWKCEHIWEYQRGFIGPSVWQHVMHRVGTEPGFFNEEQDADAATAFNKKHICAIVGGPIVVPHAGNDGGRERSRLFVAVARGPADPFAGYLSDCIVYEMNANGEPVALLNVPRMIEGARFARHDGALVWACDKDAFVRILPSDQGRGIGMGRMGDFDCLGRIDWYRQFGAPQPCGWLVTDPAGDLVAFTATHALRVASGGYVRREQDRVYRFPLEMVDLTTGAQRELTLNVPFDGKIDLPKTNYGTSELPDGSRGVRTWGPYLLGVTNLEVACENLQLTLGMEDSSWVIEFKLRDLQP
jgi:hypothetical protein